MIKSHVIVKAAALFAAPQHLPWRSGRKPGLQWPLRWRRCRRWSCCRTSNNTNSVPEGVGPVLRALFRVSVSQMSKPCRRSVEARS